MNYAEHTFGKNASGRVQMDIGEVKVQLKRHTDKQTKREVVTDIFVAWGHQQEKDSPLTVEDLSEKFDQLYKDAQAAPAAPVPAPQDAQPCPVPKAPQAASNPYLGAMCNMMSNPAMNPYLQQQLMAQQAAAFAYQQQLQQHQLMQMYADSKGFGAGKGFGKGKEGKSKELSAGAASFVPGSTPSDSKEGTGEAAAVNLPDFAPPKPRLLQIVDPTSGKPIDTMGMNFAPRKASNPLQITNPSTGEAVAVETQA
mmetsp:Transcript_24141/g.55975  ORF Transcript_24141/g.55975 Transcript_24141/m.55975 type:complete len:254 (+) Transcript_24141:1-762(+)